MEVHAINKYQFYRVKYNQFYGFTFLDYREPSKS